MLSGSVVLSIALVSTTVSLSSRLAALVPPAVGVTLTGAGVGGVLESATTVFGTTIRKVLTVKGLL